MRLLPYYRQTPPSASGRTRHDPVLALAGAGISGLFAASARRRISPPARRDDTIALSVLRRRVVARDQDVVELTLTAAGGGSLPRWYPGAHLDLHLPSGLVRQYSLCGDPSDADVYRIAVRRIPAGGGGSVEVHDALTEGAVVHTHGPRNAFPLTVPGHGSPTRRFRFIAGGIGITPVLPMLRAARRLGVDWSMIYSGRSRDSLPYLDEVAAHGSAVQIRTDDEFGLPSAATLLGDCPSDTAVYACGPAPMLSAVRAALVERDDVELHFERFAAPPVVDGRAFEVTVASTGAPVAVAADETLLAALRRAGVPAPYSCRQGFCGTCRIRVLDGAVEHRDTLLTDPERAAGQMLTCVSRAAGTSRLTLDL
ncbi:oxidoreductase [Mycolicibacterium chubuense]|uniref:Phenoxybenzoate dioxygenase subunit beta n=1 Tax=Mycolicibacterium chubuense TaxID=1800 RepID=A0A0J6WIP9_MYCCU|nr:PDR/VanB family oxidoreductase [Mycolicibacterium chubuense]KMO83175.1 Phenoxybenzoate dioxygenase subunit beta [Mycolicibacterium chubuense]ORA46099.1 oxidoreductase [Mycolicibacterium chubuense]SPX95984.1 flavodoxin reductase family protein [Mycolicibacterium chubuense]